MMEELGGDGDPLSFGIGSVATAFCSATFLEATGEYLLGKEGYRDNSIAKITVLALSLILGMGMMVIAPTLGAKVVGISITLLLLGVLARFSSHAKTWLLSSPLHRTILSFDGGGIRGIIALIFLIRLNEALGCSIQDRVDMLAGSSTGSIIAAALAAGLSPEEILDFYLQKCPKIFTPVGMYLFRFGATYSSHVLAENLEEAFDAAKIPTDIKIRDLSQKLFIATVCLKDSSGRWSPHFIHNLNETSDDVKVIDAIRMSTAAPTYFPSFEGYIDGGIAANNPSHMAHVHFAAVDKTASFSLLNFGTGSNKHCITGDEDWGTRTWARVFRDSEETTQNPILAVLLEMQEQISIITCEKTLGDSFHRMDLLLPKEIELDDYKQMQFLIDLVDQYIEENSEEWEAHCNWVKEHILGEEVHLQKPCIPAMAG